MLIFDTFWTEAFRSLMPWAEPFFRVITELGSDYYVALIAIGFWTMDKKATITTAFVLIASAVLNYWLKITIKSPRSRRSSWHLS